MKFFSRFPISLVALVCLSLGAFGGITLAANVFTLYTTLTGNEIIADQANPTGASFKTSVLGQYTSRKFWNASLTTVALLPTCASGTKGNTYYVTDANSPTYGGTLTGSSTTFAVAICDGTNWTAH